MRYVALAGLVIAAALVVGVSWQRGADERAGKEALARAEQAARDGKAITPAELTDKPFSRLVVISGGADADAIRREVGADWRRADDLAYHCCDPAPIWAFVDGDEVVAYFRASFPMDYGWGVASGRHGRDERLALSPPRRRGA